MNFSEICVSLIVLIKHLFLFKKINKFVSRSPCGQCFVFWKINVFESLFFFEKKNFHNHPFFCSKKKFHKHLLLKLFCWGKREKSSYISFSICSLSLFVLKKRTLFHLFYSCPFFLFLFRFSLFSFLLFSFLLCLPFFKNKKKQNKTGDGLMQRTSCGPDQWQLNVHRLHSLNNVTARGSDQESFQSRKQSSTLEKYFLEIKKKQCFFQIIWKKFSETFFHICWTKAFKKILFEKNATLKARE